MKVIITAATDRELEKVKQAVSALVFKTNSLQINFHNSGIGMLASCFSLTRLIQEQKPDLIIQIGIAGSFVENMPPGKVVVVCTEYLADMGVEEHGIFKDVFDMELVGQNDEPFNKKQLANPHLPRLNFLKMDEVTGATVNEITTQQNRIEQLKTKYAPFIESMEGASLHYCCLQTSTPFIQIRSISNFIGERDKTKWDFEKAFTNLADAVSKYVQELSSITQQKA